MDEPKADENSHTVERINKRLLMTRITLLPLDSLGQTILKELESATRNLHTIIASSKTSHYLQAFADSLTYLANRDCRGAKSLNEGIQNISPGPRTMGVNRDFVK